MAPESNISVVTGTHNVPVDIVEALGNMGLTTDDAGRAMLFLQAATEKFEGRTGRSLLTKTYKLTTDRWLDRHCHAHAWKYPYQHFIELPRTPLLTISSVKYWAPDAVALATLASTNYRAQTDTEPGRCVFIDDFDAPDLELRPDAIEIEFTAGYGTAASSVPALARAAVMLWARYLFDAPPDGYRTNEIPAHLMHTVDPFIVF